MLLARHQLDYQLSPSVASLGFGLKRTENT